MPLADLARAEIADLQDAGVDPTPAEIVWLNELAIEVEQPAGRVAAHAAGEPVRMGPREVMWPFTLASAEWWQWVERNRVYTTRDGARNALAFALCNGRTPDAFAGILTADDARRAVNAWTLRCGATPADREAAILRCVPEIGAPHQLPSKADPHPDPDATGALVAQLEAGTGLPGDYWRAQLLTHAVKCLQAVYQQAALGVGTMSDQSDADYRAAMGAFMRASKAIKDAHRKDRTEKDGNNGDR
jgi:hypothetical protein